VRIDLMHGDLDHAPILSRLRGIQQ
jgi:hypothetical protein